MGQNINMTLGEILLEFRLDCFTAGGALVFFFGMLKSNENVSPKKSKLEIA